jgi:hypothetical protein
MLTILVAFAAASVIALAGHHYARQFVTRRLRYVNAVHTKKAPIIAGVAAAAVAAPVMAVVPILGLGTALTFGVAVGMGVAGGSHEVQRGFGGG